MKSVLFVIPTLHGGGAERVVLTLLQHLDRSRFRPVLAVVDMRGAAYRDLLPPDIELIDLGCTRVLFSLPAILRLLWTRRPNIVFSTLGHLNLALSLVRPFFPSGVRHIARETMVVSQYLSEFRRPNLWAALYRKVYGRVDTLVCQSADMRDDLVHNFGFPLAKTRVIYNPVDIVAVRAKAAQAQLDDLAPPAGVLRLVAAGRLVEQKGFDLLIEALAMCADLPLQLDVLGEGPMRQRLDQQIAQTGQSARIRLRGFQANPYPWIAQADAFVLSSRYEGFSNVVLESLACGTPVIAMPCPGGVREALAGIPECHIAARLDAAALAASLRQWAVVAGVRVPDDAVKAYAVHSIVQQYQDVLSEEASA